MSGYLLAKLAHVLCLVYWLGADVGVFYASRYVSNPSLAPAERATALRIQAWVDQFPRYTLVATLPFGLTLALASGRWLAPPWALPAIWVASLAWLALVWAMLRPAMARHLATLRRVDLTVRIAIIIVLLGYGLQGLAGAGPITEAWVALKAVLFALIIVCGLMIRFSAAPFRPAFARMQAAGSTPELEAVISGALMRTRRYVVLIWALLVVAAWVAIARPLP